MNLREEETVISDWASKLGVANPTVTNEPVKKEELKAETVVVDSKLAEEKKPDAEEAVKTLEVIEEKVVETPVSKKEEKTAELEGLDEATKAHLEFLNDGEQGGDRNGEQKLATGEEKVTIDGKQKGERKDKQIDLNDEAVKPYVEKAKSYDSLIANPLIKALTDFIESGGTDISEFATNVAGVNVDKMDARDIYEYKLKSKGYSADDIEGEMIEFDSMSKVKQDMFVESMRDSLKKENEEKLKTFSKSTEGNKEQRMKETEELLRVQESTMADLDSQITKMVNEKYRGLLITEPMAKEIQEAAAYFAEPIYNEQKTKIVGYDTKEGIRRATLIKFEKQLFKANFELGKTIGLDEALKERHRPSKSETTSTVQVAQKMGVADAAQAAGSEMWSKRQSKF